MGRGAFLVGNQILKTSGGEAIAGIVSDGAQRRELHSETLQDRLKSNNIDSIADGIVAQPYIEDVGSGATGNIMSGILNSDGIVVIEETLHM